MGAKMMYKHLPIRQKPGMEYYDIPVWLRIDSPWFNTNEQLISIEKRERSRINGSRKKVKGNFKINDDDSKQAKYRKIKKTSLLELSQTIHVDSKLIQAFEKNKNISITMNTYVKLASFYGKLPEKSVAISFFNGPQGGFNKKIKDLFYSLLDDGNNYRQAAYKCLIELKIEMDFDKLLEKVSA